MPVEKVIHSGLEGVVVDSTRISSVVAESNTLVYYGYPVPELADECNFEEVAWLLWHGELPGAHELAMFQADGRSRRNLSKDLIEVIRRAPRTAHPMDLLRTAVSFLGMEDTMPERQDAAANLDRSISLMAKIPIMLGTFYRVRKGLEIIAPRSDLGFAQNFFYICLGKVPPPEVVAGVRGVAHPLCRARLQRLHVHGARRGLDLVRHLQRGHRGHFLAEGPAARGRQ